jgi:hypothetical protein
VIFIPFREPRVCWGKGYGLYLISMQNVPGHGNILHLSCLWLVFRECSISKNIWMSGEKNLSLSSDPQCDSVKLRRYKAWNRFFKPWSNFATWGVHLYSRFQNWGAIFVNITDFWSFIDLDFNFEVFAVILLHFNATKMNQGSYLISKNNFLFCKSLRVVLLYRNMRILRRKLRCDTAYFKPCFILS